MLVSFIIPAYNAADTLVRCMDSIYGLSLKREDFEVIVVDDCSTDNTVDVIENYRQQVESGKLKEDSLILLRQPENHRQGAARNRGVKVAKGEYICFVDADDAVTEGIVNAIRMAKEKQTDMTALHYAFANEQGAITADSPKISFAEGSLFSGVEMQNTHPYWCSAPWGYIYKRAFIEQVNYPFAEGVLYEDSDFVAVHLYNSVRMVHSSELGYIAYYREGSTTHHISYKNVADYLLLGERMYRFYEMIAVGQDLRNRSRDEKKFAEGILEGACYNVSTSCKSLIKLKSLEDVHSFYRRIDSIIDRSNLAAAIQGNSFYGGLWDTLCLKHEYIAYMLLSILIPMSRLVKSVALRR